DGGLAEDALEGEAEAQRRLARGEVQGVALPLVAPVAELVEHAVHHQIHRLGRHGRALQRRAEVDVADLDDADRRVDAQVAGEAQRLIALAVDDGVEQGIGAEAGALHPVAEGAEAGEGAVGHVGPVAALAVLAEGGKEVVGVPRRIDRLDAAAAPLHGLARRHLARLPVRHWCAQGLAEVVAQQVVLERVVDRDGHGWPRDERGLCPVMPPAGPPRKGQMRKGEGTSWGRLPTVPPLLRPSSRTSERMRARSGIYGWGRSLVVPWTPAFAGVTVWVGVTARVGVTACVRSVPPHLPPC